MVAGESSCTCAKCGKECGGLFRGCQDVWDRGSASKNRKGLRTVTDPSRPAAAVAGAPSPTQALPNPVVRRTAPPGSPARSRRVRLRTHRRPAATGAPTSGASPSRGRPRRPQPNRRRLRREPPPSPSPSRPRSQQRIRLRIRSPGDSPTDPAAAPPGSGPTGVAGRVIRRPADHGCVRSRLSPGWRSPVRAVLAPAVSSGVGSRSAGGARVRQPTLPVLRGHARP